MSPCFVLILFGFLLSALMSLVVAGIATVRNVGFADGTLQCRRGAVHFIKSDERTVTPP